MYKTLENNDTLVEHIPLTSSQKWLMGELTKMNKPGWCSVEFLVKTTGPMVEAVMREAVFCIVSRYETLRVKIVNTDGQWIQEVYRATDARPFDLYDLSEEEPAAMPESIRRICTRERDWMLPATGNLFRIVFFKLSETEGRLWFCMHHVISDFVSAMILTNEFMSVYSGLLQGKEQKVYADLNYRKMMYLLDGYCRDILLPTELPYWVSFPWDHAKMLPTDYPADFPNVGAVLDALYGKKILKSFRVYTTVIDERSTLKLFGKYHTDIESLIISVFFLAVSKGLGIDCMDFNVCNSGRNILPQEYGINVSKLLGFLSVSRVVLLKSPAAGDAESEVGEVVGQIKAIPNLGLGYYLITDFIKDQRIKTAYQNLRKPCFIFFNYLGRSDSNFGNEQYQVVQEDTGLNRDEVEIRSNLLECLVSIRKNQLTFELTYTAAYFKQETIERIGSEISAMCEKLTSILLNENVA